MSFQDSASASLATRTRAAAEVLIAADDGRIVYGKPRARRWLRDFFSCKEAPSRLPRALHAWLTAPRATPGGPLVPLAVNAGGERLLVRAAHLGVERSHCLVLELRPAETRANVSARWGLTQRQAEVLKWLVCGKSNGEIAAILGRKPDTVAKHLQGVFDKLGVDNRCGAVAMAWQAQLA